jgi:hypothetical protein
VKRLFVLAALTATIVAATGMVGAPAWAHATTRTFHIHNGTQTFVDRVPCIGGKATITLTFNAVFHRTRVAPHLIHVTETMAGTFVAVPLHAGRPTFTGHFTQWDGFNSNRQTQTGTFTFSIHGVGSDGSTVNFHEVAHFTMTKNGVTFGFDKVRCG